MNLGFTSAAEVTRRAEALGASATGAPNLLWLIIMSSGFVANGIYCGYLLVKKGKLRKISNPQNTSLSGPGSSDGTPVGRKFGGVWERRK